MNTQILALIFSSVLLASGAQLALKIGVGSASNRSVQDPVAEMLTMIQSPATLVGLAMYGSAALLWLFVLARAPLSLVYPFVGIGFIITMMIGYFYFGETVSASRTIGTLMIATGCILVARSA